MVKSGSGRKRRAVAEAEAPAGLDAEETLGADAPADNGAAQPSRHSSQPNPYFDDDDEELQTYEDEFRFYETEATRAADESKTPLSATEEEKLVRDVMRHMVFRNQVKPDVPVPRADLAKLCPAQRKGSSTMVIRLAQAMFPDALGMEMKEIRIPSARTNAATDDGAKYYVLRSYLPKAVRKDFLQRRVPDALPTQAFELTVLALIVMNGDRISDDDLWRLLDDVGVQVGPTSKAHPVFGKPEDRIKAMIQKKYLREQKGRGGDQGKTYEWGTNADDEITRAKVDDFIRQTIDADAT